MKIKTLLIAMMAIMATAVSFTSCSDDDDVSENWTKYQQAVDKNVKSNKKHDKAILLVAFGSTWQQAFNAFDATKKAYEAEFGQDYDVYVSFSSAICINRAAAGEHVEDGAEVRNYYAPNFWLHGLGKAKYDEIVVQSLQVIPGEEFTRVVNYMKDFANNSLGDLDDNYLENVSLKLGTPLLDTQDDVQAVASALHEEVGSKLINAADKYVLFMGHGNPDTYDTYKGNVRYTQLEEALQDLNPNYFVGTVDMPENYKTNVLDRMKTRHIVGGTVYLQALMSIAGDHANNDMAGDDGEDMDPEEYEYNDEGEVEDLSWKCFFAQNGFTCDNSTCTINGGIKGLLEVDGVLKVWIKHTRAAVEGEPLEDYYHSKDPFKE